MSWLPRPLWRIPVNPKEDDYEIEMLASLWLTMIALVIIGVGVMLLGHRLGLWHAW
jgi:hypothetical protein